jgi:DNA helicase-2/ATP-dependent DNA helicase PcrA
MTVVGDDDQSIYSWRGAKSSNINRFIKDFKGVKTLKLEQNYRSTTNILSAANAVIRNNPERLGKELWTEKEEGELVKIYRAFNERDEAKFIVDIIKSWVDEGRNLSECAIIYRSNAQSRILEDSILRADLPYRIYGGVRFYERLEIKNALAYAKLAIDQKNDAAFERIINIPTRGVGAKTMDQIREIAREENSSLWIAAKTFADSAGPKIANSLKTFFKLIENFSESAAKKEIEEFFENLIESSNLKNFHGKEPGEKGRSRVENLEELVSAAAGYFSIGEDADDERSQLELFLDQASLDAGENQAEENEDAIQMMTLQSSKGLEYALVFIAGCEEGLFPHKRSTEDPRQLAEERRLCYVGMTRAMERLYLTYAEVRNVYGVDGFSPASRFLKEIPEEFKYEIRMASENINKSKSFSPKIVGGTDHKVGGFALGDRVGHPSFGEGVILNYEGDGSNARVQVNFDQEGTKWLVLSFAKLNKI